MSKLHIKKGDTVYVNAGEDKGKTGRVLKVLVDEASFRIYNLFETVSNDDIMYRFQNMKAHRGQLPSLY